MGCGRDEDHPLPHVAVLDGWGQRWHLWSQVPGLGWSHWSPRIPFLHGEDLNPARPSVKQRERVVSPPHSALFLFGWNCSSLGKMEMDPFPESSFTIFPKLSSFPQGILQAFFPSQRPDVSSEAPGFLQRLLFAQESPQFSKLSCQNLSEGMDLPHVFTIKLHVTLHLMLKREASLARRLLEDIDFAAFFWCLCIKTSFKVLVKGRYCWADSGFMLCFSFLSGFLRSICPTCL